MPMRCSPAAREPRPDPATARQAATGAVHAAQADAGAGGPGRRCRGGGLAGAHRRQDQRPDRRAPDRSPDRCGVRRGEDRSHRARRLHAAPGSGRRHRGHPRALDRRALPRTFAHRLFPLGRRRRRRGAVPLERRLDGPQHVWTDRSRLAGARREAPPAPHRRMSGALSARRPRRLDARSRRQLCQCGRCRLDSRRVCATAGC